MTTPRVVECPAKLWPPLRIATCRPCRPANAIASETSWAVELTTNASGATSWNRLLNGRLDASYVGEPGRATSPAITRWSDPQSSMTHPIMPPGHPSRPITHGSIIAAIIVTHSPTNDPNEPSSVATPMSMPSIAWAATTQAAARDGRPQRLGRFA